MNWRFWQKKALQKQTVTVPFRIVNGTIISPADNKQTYIDEGYTYNDIIYSIINLICDKVRLPEWNQYKVVDESSLKSYIGLMKRKDLTFEDIKKARDFKTKALELIPGDGKLAELLKWANDTETFSDMVANGTGYKLVTGDRMMTAEMLKAGANRDKPHKFYNLPVQEVTIEASRTFPQAALFYKIQSLQVNYEASQVLHDKFWNPDWDSNGNHLYGLSPLKAALYTYKRNNSAKTSSKSSFDNKGMEGIIYADIDPASVNANNVGVLLEQANKTKQMLTGPEYAGSENRGKVAATAYRMGYTQVGLSPVDLNIIESEKWDLKRLCAVYGVPPQLLGDGDTSTYNNVKEAEKALTARVAIPLLNSFKNNFNQKLSNDWGYKGKNIYVDYDQTVFTELEENTKDKAEWVTKLWMLPPNRQLELMNLETVDNPLFDEPWIDGSKTPLSEYMANGVDDALNNQNGNV